MSYFVNLTSVGTTCHTRWCFKPSHFAQVLFSKNPVRFVASRRKSNIRTGNTFSVTRVGYLDQPLPTFEITPMANGAYTAKTSSAYTPYSRARVLIGHSRL